MELAQAMALPSLQKGTRATKAASLRDPVLTRTAFLAMDIRVVPKKKECRNLEARDCLATLVTR
jgi:hypothetical protein